MKIISWVLHIMVNPMPPTFGRIDALRGSSVEIIKITDFTKRYEIESWVPHIMDNPMAFSFGRIDAFFGSLVEISKFRFYRTP